MNRTTSLLILLASLSVSPAVVGQDTCSWTLQEGVGICDVSEDICDVENFAIFFANGAFNNPEKAKENMERLKRRMKAYLLGNMFTSAACPDWTEEDFKQRLDFQLAYNTSICEQDGDSHCTSDLLQMTIQEVGEEHYLDTWKAIGDFNCSWFPGVNTEVTREVLDNKKQVSSTFSRAKSLIATDLSTITEDVRRKLSDGKRVVVVSHSQGSYFANEVFSSRLETHEKSFVGLVSVGSPVSSVADRRGCDAERRGRWINALSDDVLETLCEAPSFIPLPPNVDVGDITPCDSDHGWSQTYMDAFFMNPNSAADDIIEAVLTTYDDLADIPMSVSPVQNGSFTQGMDHWLVSQAEPDFWAGFGDGFTRYKTPPGYAAGGVDAQGYHKSPSAGLMMQTVTIPSDWTEALLRFELWIDPISSAPPTDWFNMEVINQAGFCYKASWSNADFGGWYEPREIDLAQFIGQTIRLQFHSRTTGLIGTTVFRVDDVLLENQSALNPTSLVACN